MGWGRGKEWVGEGPEVMRQQSKGGVMRSWRVRWGAAQVLRVQSWVGGDCGYGAWRR